MTSGNHRLDITVAAADPLYVRTGSILQYPDSVLTIPHKTRLLFSRISKQMYFLHLVRNGSLSLTTPYENASISRIRLQPDELFIIKMDHILAFSSGMFFNRRRRIDVIGLLSNRFRHVHFRGPGVLYCFGFGDLDKHILQSGTADYAPGSVLGWSNTLAVGVTSRSSLASALFAMEDICLDRFVGSGTVLTQSSTVTKLPKPFHDPNANSSWLDYLNAIVGLKG